MSARTKKLLSLAANAIVVICTVYGVYFTAGRGGAGNMRVGMSSMAFRFFTVDSNILAALSCLPVIFFTVKSLKDTETAIPHWAAVFKFAGTAAVTVTLLTVAFFLGPIMGYGAMLAGANFFMHLSNPLLALLAFILEYPAREVDRLTKKDCLTGDLPVLVYGILYFVMVIIVGQGNGGWPDFYGFNRGGLWYVSMAVMFGGGYLLCRVLRLLQRRLGVKWEE